MTTFLEILKYILPSLVVLAMAWLMLREFLKSEKEKYQFDVKAANHKVIAPLKIQAYERIVLYLERIIPNNLVLRVNIPGMTAVQLKVALLKSIREEFDHNLSQQLFISSHAWELVKNAKEDLINTINIASASLNGNTGSADLSKAIFDKYLAQKNSPIDMAIEYLKEEMRNYYLARD